MRNLGNKLINTICHIIIDGQAHEKFYVAAHFLMVFQTMAAIAHPSSTFFNLVKWFDPSTFLAPSFTIIICSIIILLFASILIFKIIITEHDQMLARPNTLKVYLGNALLHLQMMSKTIVLGPVIRSSLLQIQNPQGNEILAMGIIGLTIFSILLLPVSLYNTSNTFVLTPQLNKKLYYINVYTVLNIFRVILSVVSVLSQSFMGPLCAAYFIVFMILSIKQPVFAYSHEQLLRGMVSSIAFSCLSRIITQSSNSVQPIYLELVGLLGFIPFIGWISDMRLHSILDLAQPTIHQIKILLFMLGNMEDYMDKLEMFIFKHHKTCNNLQCKCEAVIRQISQKTAKSQAETIWYDFIFGFISHYYNLEDIVKLPSSQLKLNVEKYQQIVVDLAEINMFKLGRLNEAYYLLKNFQLEIENRGMNFLSFKQKKKIIIYYLQQSIIARYKTDGVTNLYADNYMNFQIQYEKFRALLLKTANSTASLWQEMNKRQPHAPTLHKYLANLERQNAAIRDNYKAIIGVFEDSKSILEKMTNDYFIDVLNIPQKSPYHVIEPPRFQSLFDKKEEKIERISENMQAFSLNSQTPMCFVSVDEGSLGDIKGCNAIFNQAMSLEFAKKSTIQDFMVPEMRESHHTKMKSFLKEGNFTIQHNLGYNLTAKGKIIHSKVLIQIFPSIADGLTYVFFLKKLSTNKKIFALKNNQSIPYVSQQFQQLFQPRFSKEELLQGLKDELLNEIRQKKLCKIKVQNCDLHVKFLRELPPKDGGYMYLQILDDEDLRRQAKVSALGDRSTTTRYFEASSSGFGSDIRKEDIPNQSQLEKSDLMQKSLAQQVKVMLKGIKQSFNVITDPKKQKVINKVIIFNLAFVAILTSILIVCIVFQQNNRAAYITNFNVNKYYNNFILLISRAVTQAKNINFYSFTTQTTSAATSLSIFTTLTKINPAMDQLVSNFDIAAISQIWPTFSVKTDRTFNIGSQTNFLAVSDYIQNQVTNLAALSITSFNFPLAMEMINKPLTSTATTLYQLVTNSIYQQLPRFRNLKRNKMNSTLSSSIDTLMTTAIVISLIIVISLAYVIGMVVINLRVTTLKDYSYRYFQGLSSEFIKEKEDRCRQFIVKYTDFTSNSKLLENTNARSMNIDRKNTNDKYSSGNDEHTDREMSLRQESKLIESKNFDMEQETQAKLSSVVRTTKNQKIFEESSYYWLFLKYLIPSLPFIIFSIAVVTRQVNTLRQIRDTLAFQQNMQTMQQDIHLVLLYAQQYGIYRPEMEVYQSIPTTLSDFINEMYSIQRGLVASNYNPNVVPLTDTFKNAASYGNLCEMTAMFVSSYSFANMNNKTFCSTIGDNVLTKGFYSSIIGYLESINTLRLSNPNTTGYTSAQKVAYLKSDFFADTSRIVNFFDRTLDTLLYYMQQDFNNFVLRASNEIIYSALGMIGLLFLLIVLLHRYYISSIKEEITQITSLFSLISYDSVLKDEQLKVKFSEKIEDFKKLE